MPNNKISKTDLNHQRRHRVITALLEKATRCCSICRQPFIGFGNNPAPINDGVCCDECNGTVVIPARFAVLSGISR